MGLFLVAMRVTICFLLFSATFAFTVSTGSSRIHGGRPLAAVSRRDLVTAGVTAGLVAAAPWSAGADIDYSKVQDLLGSPDGSETQTYSPSGRPTYLTEPTEEFKRNEAKATQFKQAQIQRKKAFLALLDKLDSDPNDQELLAKDLDEMRRSIREAGGLPLGITKEELVKRIRRRKAKRYWPVQVEIAYQDLLEEIRQQQSPNGKDEDNPL